jgi:sugar transferase (PEP-CTERM/EpsH1 system associated)
MIKMSFKIVHLVYSFGCGGLEKVITNLINYSTHHPIQHIIISLTDDIDMSEQINEDVSIYVLDKKSGNDFKTHIKLYKLLKALKPNVIQTYNFGTIEYHLTAMLAGVPRRIHSDHGRGGDDPQGNNKLHNYFRTFVAHFIHKYVVVSEDLYSWVTQTLHINKNKVELVFNGVAVPQDITKKQGRYKKFVTVGRLNAVKNQSLMIDAFTQAKMNNANFKDCTLDIVGDGELFEDLSKKITDLNMTHCISLVGYKANINDILINADVFVLSSVYEAMPMTILEAIAVKTPVICTKVGGISKFVNDEHVYFVESKNVDELAKAFIEISAHEEITKNRIDNAYKLLISKYTIELMVEHYLTIYAYN